MKIRRTTRDGLRVVRTSILEGSVIINAGKNVIKKGKSLSIMLKVQVKFPILKYCEVTE